MAVIDQELDRLGRPDLRQISQSGVVFMLAAVSATSVGALLLVRRPTHPVAWCLAVLGAAVTVTGVCQGYGLLGLVADPDGHHPGASAAAVAASSLFVVYLVSIASICFLTPDGRQLSPRWRTATWVMAASGAVWFLTILVGPTELEAPFRSVQNPWGIEALRTPLAVLRTVAAGLNNVLVLSSFVCLALRFRRAEGEQRRQLLWLVAALVPLPFLVTAAFVAAMTREDLVVNVAAGLFVAILPLAVGLAVAKTRLYDVDRILSRALSYALVSAVLVGTYALVVLFVSDGLRGAAGDTRLAVSVAAVVATFLARPVYAVVQDRVDRRFLRRRHDALRRVRSHVADPDISTSIEQVLREALEAPELVVSYWVTERHAWFTLEGRPSTPADDAVEVRRAGRVVARVSGLDPDRELTQAVLHEAEPELDNSGLRASVAVQLEQVRASRERLADAHAQERRRIERDLHDGAQQRLLALAAQLQAALLNGGPDRLREGLATGVRESQTVVRELRELANGLHPSVLTDGGLAAAMDDLASRHRLRLVMPEPDRRYPERVEGTAWFIACEAVANAAKHAKADEVQVRVERDGNLLRVVIEDDGRGGADAAGSGLRGLADRAEAAGGQLWVLPREPRGTMVMAELPCA